MVAPRLSGLSGKGLLVGFQFSDLSLISLGQLRTRLLSVRRRLSGKGAER